MESAVEKQALSVGYPIPAPPSDDSYEQDPQKWDMIVIGAGISGCAMAQTQALLGKRVLLLERELSQPERYVGEFLQPGGIMRLKDMGLERTIQDIDAQPIFGVRYTVHGQTNELPYDNPGVCLHHGRFVQRLRYAASSNKTVTLRKGIATGLLNSDGKILGDSEAVGGVTYKTPDGVVRKAMSDLTVVCDGMHSNLRQKVTGQKFIKTAYTCAVTLTGITELDHRNWVQVFVGEPLFSLYPISSSEIRLMVSMPGLELPNASTGEFRDYLIKVVYNRLPDDLKESFMRSFDEAPIRSLQTKRMPAVNSHRPGVILIGDALNMRHPATGAGMTIALNDVKMISDMLAAGRDFVDPVESGKNIAEFLSRRKPLSATMNMQANLLYDSFVVKAQEQREPLLVALGGYLSKGGWNLRNLAMVSGGLDPRPYMILYHAVNIFQEGVWRLFLSSPSFDGLRSVLRMVWCEAPIVWNLIQNEGGIRAVFSKSPVTPKELAAF